MTEQAACRQGWGEDSLTHSAASARSTRHLFTLEFGAAGSANSDGISNPTAYLNVHAQRPIPVPISRFHPATTAAGAAEGMLNALTTGGLLPPDSVMANSAATVGNDGPTPVKRTSGLGSDYKQASFDMGARRLGINAGYSV